MTYDDRDPILSQLGEAIDRAGGWVLERHAISAHAVALQIELQTRALIEVYAALVGSGIELTRAAHLALSERCTCMQHVRSRKYLGTILSIRLEVVFLSDLPATNGWKGKILQATGTA